MKDVEFKILKVLEKISGKFFFNLSIFGPTDCDVRALPQKLKIFS